MSTDADDAVVDASNPTEEPVAPSAAVPDPASEDFASDRPTTASEEGGKPSEIERLRAERDEYLDALRRLQAEFENFRKRTVRQQTELLERASVSLLEALLPVLDALDLALAHLGEDEAARDALVQIAGLLRSTLEKEGLERIADVGAPFDPTRHDAVAHVERDPDADEGHGAVVAEVLRAGYTLKGRVLRPAMVKVEG